MKKSKQEYIINYSAKDLYNIVLDIENYPEFIPWCSYSKINHKTNKYIIADLEIDYKFYKKTFTSKVEFDSNNLIINVKYIKGPLKNLKTNWQFNPITKNKTNVLFSVKFEFKKFLHQKIAETFYPLIEIKMIDSFEKRANQILN